MQSLLSLSTSHPHSAPAIAKSNHAFELCSLTHSSKPLNLQFCGFRREALGFSQLKRSESRRFVVSSRRQSKKLSASLADNGSAPKSFDYDLVIIGAGVGGHGAALHAVEKGLKTAIIEGDVIGGTCVNRGCVPSKALLAVSGRMRELRNDHHLKALGLQVSAAGYDRQGVADHANNLASKIRNNLTNSLKALGVDILTGVGTILGPQKVKYGKVGHSDNVVTTKDIIIATGSVPFVPKGIEVDGKTVITSDHALKLEFVPEWIAIVGSGYIGLEFSDVYTALGSEVTFIEALDQLMPGFDPEIGKLAQRVLINPRKIDYHTGVFASKITPAKDGKPVTIELIDAKTKELKDTLEVDAALIAQRRSSVRRDYRQANLCKKYQLSVHPKMEGVRKEQEKLAAHEHKQDAKGSLKGAVAAAKDTVMGKHADQDRHDHEYLQNKGYDMGGTPAPAAHEGSHNAPGKPGVVDKVKDAMGHAKDAVKAKTSKNAHEAQEYRN